MKRIKYLIGLVLFSLVILLNLSKVSAHEIKIPPVPTDIPIVDQTNTLTAEQKTSLANKIAAERDKSSNQIAVLMVSSLEGDSVEDYSLQVARKWGIGTKDKNNGVLLFIAKDDRKLRIEVGYGLEGALTDATASQIIRNQITPQFKTGNYYQGIDAGITSIIAAIHNEYKASDQNSSRKANTNDLGTSMTFIGIFAYLGLWLVSVMARSSSWWAGGIFGFVIGAIVAAISQLIWLIFIFIGVGLMLDYFVSKNYKDRVDSNQKPSWWAGGTHFGGGSSGGGFGGFGGGSFGGGGSSGSW